MSEVEAATADLLKFIDAGPTPFHVVAELRRRLEAAGFVGLEEAEAWNLAPGDRRYVIRGETTLAAFIVGAASPEDAGFRLVGAHTDSPNLRLKPRPDFVREGYRQLGVEVYGGVLLSTWIDRDLALAGRVVHRDGPSRSSRLVDTGRAVARVPALAIHLDREANEHGILDRQKHLAPVLGLEDAGRDFRSWLADLAGLERSEDILSFDLMFHVAQPSVVGGADGEFVHAPRLDNLASCHAALTALIEGADESLDAGRAIVLYDHEEVGSGSAQGAASSFLGDLLGRVVAASGGGVEACARSRARSLMLSADMAHAVHPNQGEKHDPEHKPRINAGPVIKVNANARYATSATTSAAFQELCRDAGVPWQEFVMRTDMPCGSTIGPIVAARLGIPTVDVGNPMLSMHSAREMAGSRDQELMIRALRRHFS